MLKFSYSFFSWFCMWTLQVMKFTQPKTCIMCQNKLCITKWRPSRVHECSFTWENSEYIGCQFQTKVKKSTVPSIYHLAETMEGCTILQIHDNPVVLYAIKDFVKAHRKIWHMGWGVYDCESQRPKRVTRLFNNLGVQYFPGVRG